MKAHTPGPWEVFESATNALGIGPSDVMICEIVAEGATDEAGPNSPDEITDEDRANARLIAAAPELLAACLTVKRFLTGLEDGTGKGDPLRKLREEVHEPLHAALDAAIAKAEGNIQSAPVPNPQALTGAETSANEKEKLV